MVAIPIFFSPNSFQLQTLVEVDSVRNGVGVLSYFLLHSRFQLSELEGAASSWWTGTRHTLRNHSGMICVLLPSLREEGARNWNGESEPTREDRPEHQWA